MNWPEVPIGDIFEVARGGSPRPIDKFITDDPDGLNWVMIGDATASGKYIKATKKKIRHEGLKKTRQVKPGDFILSNSMSFGRPYIMGIDGCIHDGWLLLRPQSDQICPDYFYHLLGSQPVYAKFASRAAGATVKNLNSGIVREVQIPLPPLEEQKRVAGILDQAANLCRLRARTLDKLNTLGQAIFHEMFGSLKGYKDTHPESLNAEVDALNIKTLGEEITLQRGYDIVKKDVREGEVPVISSGGVSYFHNEPKANGPGVVLGRKGSVGNVHFVEGPYWPHDTTLFVKEFRGNHPVFVYYFFLQFGLKEYEASAANPSLNRNNLHPLLVKWPSSAAQNAFAERVNKIEEFKPLLERQEVQSETLFASLQHRAFRGEL